MGVGIIIGAISAMESQVLPTYLCLWGYSLFLMELNAQQIDLLLIIGLPAIGLVADLMVYRRFEGYG
jgi:hypothetical protein